MVLYDRGHGVPSTLVRCPVVAMVGALWCPMRCPEVGAARLVTHGRGRAHGRCKREAFHV
eukprot:2990003-Pyramimonas_sp.AAC.1